MRWISHRASNKKGTVMATYTIRGTSHNIVYTYKTIDGKRKQQWESYSSELEAIQRKAYIDYLQAQNRASDITHEAAEYRRKKAIEKTAQKIAAENAAVVVEPPSIETEDNMSKTYREFMERFLPIYARKRNLSPKTYDSYRQNLETHIYPYFGDWVMSAITSSAIDGFIDHLFQKPCRGSKSYGKRVSDIPTLSSGTVKKCYNILTLGFETARRWNYISEIPNTKGPSEHYKKRRAWSSEHISRILEQIQDDPILHLSVHLAFICSLRAGEIAAIDINSINLDEGSMWISQILERVSDESLKTLSKEKITKVFPKQFSNAKSRLVLKTPKTEGSLRKQYLTRPLVQEIKERIAEINKAKELLGPEYQDNGFLICQSDGRPVDPNNLCESFKEWQSTMNITDQIDLQGLRKSGQMHKIRLTKNNYQLVAANAGQSPEVLMHHYNEALEAEKQQLASMVESSFYPSLEKKSETLSTLDPAEILKLIQENPDLAAKPMQLLKVSA